jgi:hypothetical protein
MAMEREATRAGATAGHDRRALIWVKTEFHLLVVTLVLAACSAQPAAVVSTRPSSTPAPAPPAAPVTSGPTSPPAPADVGDACTVPRQTFTSPSIRLEDIDVADAGGSDRITFVFGPGNQPTELAFVESAQPPFPEGQSNNPVDVEGDQFLRVLFRGVLQPPATGGEEVFVGERDIRPDLAAIRQVVVTDEFEGVMEFIVGYVGGGCVSLDVDEKGGSVTVEIAHAS